MYVKVYTYHVQPDKTSEFLDILKQAQAIYEREISTEMTVLQSKDDPAKWMEISRYNSEETYRKGMEQLEGDEEIRKLFIAFQSVLIPEKNDVQEGSFEEVSIHDR
ncbi:antibiotic biosynthesis monooxygenase [Halobacillus litoralis]|uniref:antibiotic biosynthesis monooxygenase n=1 Tax=Halobacillus litoralis TaxID=45668 RepID=UPI001CFC7CF9|nr:antibiotic biosynthesis monooxygenase [Halobacillus litoralis]